MFVSREDMLEIRSDELHEFNLLAAFQLPTWVFQRLHFWCIFFP